MSATALELMDAYEKGYARGMRANSSLFAKMSLSDRANLKRLDGCYGSNINLITAWNVGYQTGEAVKELGRMSNGDTTGTH